VSRDDEIEAILEHGRQTRTRPSRWLWIVSALVGGCCALGFAFAMLGDGAPAPGDATGGVVERRPASGGGLGIGLVIGACVGIVIGFSIARQRANHSSRNSP
jgi:hypothetical protein